MLFDSTGRVLGTMDAPDAVARAKGLRVALEARGAPKRPPLPPIKPRPIKKPSGGPKPNPVRKPTGAPKAKAATELVETFAPREPAFVAHPAARRAHLRSGLAAKI